MYNVTVDDSGLVTMPCRFCGKEFTFDPSVLPKAEVKRFSENPPGKTSNVFPLCPHCSRPNIATFEERP